MSCGCGEGLAADVLRTRGAMCAMCRPARRKGVDADGFAVLCVDGKPLAGPAGRGKIESPTESCPIGRWPDERGRVSWCGVRWSGVPAPVRWWLEELFTARPAGCGCIRPLKYRWRRVQRRWRRGRRFRMA